MPIVSRDDALREILGSVHRVAVLGATKNEAKAGFYVPKYLKTQGYEILPVNPVYAGEILHGVPVVALLGELEEVDMVDVFRRTELLADHVDELVALAPKVVWFQLGIADPQVSEVLSRAGITVVESRCALAEHKRLGVARS